MNTYRCGDAIAIDATLLLNGAAEPGLSGVAVQAALVAPGGALVPGSTVTATVDPATSRAAATWPSSLTSTLTPGVYQVAFRGQFAQGPITYLPAAITLSPALFP